MTTGRLLRNLFSSYAAFAVTTVLGFAIIRVLYRRLGAEEFAAYSLALAFLAALELLNITVGDVLIRFVGAHRAKADLDHVRRLAATSFWTMTGFGAVVTAAVVIGARGLTVFVATPQMRALAVPLFVIMGCSVVFHFASAVLSAYLWAVEDFHLSAAVDSGYQLVRAIAIIAIAYLSGSILWVAVVFPIAAALRMSALLVAAARSSVPFLPRPRLVDFELLEEMRTFSLLTFLEDNARRLFLQSDMFVAGRFLPLVDVALLSVARRFPNGVSALPSQALLVAYPKVIAAHHSGEERPLRAFTIIAARNILAMLIPVIIALWVWAEVLLRVWIGPNVVAAAPLLRILLICALFRALYESPLTVAYGTNRIAIGARIAVVMLIAFLIGGVVAAWNFGTEALVIVYSAVQAIGVVVLQFHVFRVTSTSSAQWLKQAILPLVLPTVLAGAFLAYCGRAMPQTFISMLLSSLAGWIIFAGSFVTMVNGFRVRPLKTQLRLLLEGSE